MIILYTFILIISCSLSVYYGGRAFFMLTLLRKRDTIMDIIKCIAFVIIFQETLVFIP